MAGPGSLKEFYFDVEGDVIEDRPPATAARPSSAASTSSGTMAPLSEPLSSAAPSSSDAAITSGTAAAATEEGSAFLVNPAQPQDPAHQVIDAGKQYEKLECSYRSLVILLDHAKSGNAIALSHVVSQYGFNPREIKVTITEPMRDSMGNEPMDFGIKLVNNDDEFAALSRDWEMARAYFPGIELHSYATMRRGRRLAVVMGVSARDFNAVVAAERRKASLEGDMRALNDNMEKGRKEMKVDKVPRMPAGPDKKPLPETPAQGKSQVISFPSR